MTIEILALVLAVEGGCVVVLLAMMGCFFERELREIARAVRDTRREP